eukprot:31192-Pelagococcus_subviridis.AAC.3
MGRAWTRFPGTPGVDTFRTPPPTEPFGDVTVAAASAVSTSSAPPPVVVVGGGGGDRAAIAAYPAPANCRRAVAGPAPSAAVPRGGSGSFSSSVRCSRSMGESGPSTGEDDRSISSRSSIGDVGESGSARFLA